MRRNLIKLNLALLMVFVVAAPSARADVQDILGKWTVKAETPNGPLELELELKLQATELVATLGTFQGIVPLSDLKFEDPELSAVVSLGDTKFKLTGVLKDGKITGKYEQIGGDTQGPWTAERKSPPSPTLTAGEGISGSWTSVSATPNGDLTMLLELKQEGEKITGSLGSDMGKIPIQAASFKDSKLQFDVEFGGAPYRVVGTLKDDKFAGQWSAVGGTDSGAWSAARKASAPAPATPVVSTSLDGTWNSVAVTPDGNIQFEVSFSQTGETVAGNVVSPQGNIPLQKGRFANNALSFEIEYGGSTYRIEAILANGKFTGKWAAISGPETGAWSAERKTP